MHLRAAWRRHRGRTLMKVSNYPDAQHRHFARFRRQDSITMLEIGVALGGSLDLYRTYFGPKATLVGIDVDPACAEFDDPDNRTHVRIGDQTDRAFLESVAGEFGPFDIVVDDGGHTMEQQKTAFEVLLPHVRDDGGVYMCEDAFSSYLEEYGGGWGRTDTFLEQAKQRVDELHAWMNPDAPPTTFTRTVASVHFYFGLVVFEKQKVEAPRFMTAGALGIHYVPYEPILFD